MRIDMTTYCGKICIIGRPNVGKSTLFNHAIGEKISIVTHKAQTTRRQIKGIYTSDRHQIIFIDTPGINANVGRRQNRQLNRQALTALADIDAVVFMLERDRWQPEDDWILDRLRTYTGPVVAVINKMDQVSSERLLKMKQTLEDKFNFSMILPISALKSYQTDLLIEHLKLYLPEGSFEFGDDITHDVGDQFFIEEIIREKMLLNIHEEIPYLASIQIDEWIENDARFSISATIQVDQIGQKKIIIGHEGQRIKKIGKSARIDIERHFDRKMHLNLWVKVKKDRV